MTWPNWASWHLRSPATQLKCLFKSFFKANNDRNINALYYWHFVKGIHWWTPHTKGQQCGKLPISWHHNALIEYIPSNIYGFMVLFSIPCENKPVDMELCMKTNKLQITMTRITGINVKDIWNMALTIAKEKHPSGRIRIQRLNVKANRRHCVENGWLPEWTEGFMALSTVTSRGMAYHINTWKPGNHVTNDLFFSFKISKNRFNWIFYFDCIQFLVVR